MGNLSTGDDPVRTATLRMTTMTPFAALAVALLCMGTPLSARGAAATSTPAASESKETREKMATLHEQMATCLRSDKSVAECHKEMKKSCRETLGAQACPMMGMRHDKGRSATHETPMTNASDPK
jgi:hypothetical protein